MTTVKSNFLAYAKWFAIAFIIILVLLHLIKPELDPSWNFISEYQVGRHGWLMQMAFIFLGLSCLFLSVGFWNSLPLVGKIGIILIVISAMGMFIGGIFKTDPLNTPPQQQTMAGGLHQIGAMLDQLPFAAIFITIALFRKEDWKRQRWPLLLLTLLLWFGFVCFVLSVQAYFPADGKFGPNVPVGWQNRLMIVTQAVWLCYVAGQARRKITH